MGVNRHNRHKPKVLYFSMVGVVVSAVLLVALPGVSGHGWKVPKAAQLEKNPVPSDAASIGRGKQIFLRRCAICHGEKADGQSPLAGVLSPPPADLRFMAGKHPDGEFAWKIEHGRGAMPPFKGQIAPNSIWDLVNFIQGLQRTSK